MVLPRRRPSLGAAVLVCALTAGLPGCASSERRTPESDTPASSTGDSATTERSRVPTALAPFVDDTPQRPASPAEAAALLTAAHTVVRRRGAAPRLVAAAGHAQQVAVREVVQQEGWLDEVLGRLPPPARRFTEDSVAARRDLRSMHPADPADLSSQLPAWRIDDPAPARVLLRSYREAERRSGVDWEVLAAINLVETTLGRIRGTSVAGARGPMQFIPTTWDIYGEGADIEDAHDSILAAGRLLAANGFSADPTAALMRYNNHPAYARAIRRHAATLRREPRQLEAYRGWQVYYLTDRGSVWLPAGYDQAAPLPVRRYLREHPERLP